MFDELQHFAQALFAHISHVELFEVGKGACLERDEQTGQDLLVGHGIGFQVVGANIVDGLDKEDVGIDVIEVFDESAVSAGAEKQTAVGVAERRAVGIGSHGVGRGFLL